MTNPQAAYTTRKSKLLLAQVLIQMVANKNCSSSSDGECKAKATLQPWACSIIPDREDVEATNFYPFRAGCAVMLSINNMYQPYSYRAGTHPSPEGGNPHGRARTERTSCRRTPRAHRPPHEILSKKLPQCRQCNMSCVKSSWAAGSRILLLLMHRIFLLEIGERGTSLILRVPVTSFSAKRLCIRRSS